MKWATFDLLSAWVAARYGSKTIGGQAGASLVNAFAAKLLNTANEESTGQLWASLNRILPLLAEAAPEEFLSALEEGIKNPELQLAFIFQDKENDSSFSSSSPHTGFLWAVEGLAWSPRFLLRASYVLCKLSGLDPGGKLVNRPIGSLKDIFLSWHHQTSADTQERIEVLKEIVSKYPSTGWTLLLAILPEGHGFTTGTHKPKWQEWAPDKITFTYGDLFKVVDVAAALIVENVGNDVSRWRELLEHYKELPPQAQEQINEKMANLDLSSINAGGQKELWNAVRDFVHKHKRFSKTKWAVDKSHVEAIEKTLKRLEPSDPKDKYEWLFSHHVTLPVDEDGWQKHELEVKNARIAAATELYNTEGMTGLLDFANKVGSAHYLGVALGQVDVISDNDHNTIFTHICDQNPAGQAARAFVIGGFYPEGWEWASKYMSASDALKSDPNALGMFLAQLPNSKKTWEIVRSQAKQAQEQYWKYCNPHGLEDNDDYLFVAQNLLEADRPYDAVDVLGGLLEQATKKPNVDLALRALEASVKSDPSAIDLTMFSYYVTKLLDFLDNQAEADKSRLAQIEWQLLPLLKDERGPKILHNELADNPKFFAEVMEWVYRARGSEKKKLSQEEKARARLGHELLDSWRTIPGMQDDGIDQAQLNQWADTARELLEKSGRKEIGDQIIGQILSHGPSDADGSWPSLPVRDLIERLESKDIEDGFRIAVFNSRGVTSRSHGEGGNQERELAKKYDELAKKAELKWPRTALALLRIADTWRREAEHHDNKAVEDELE